nr:ATP synthase F0 subunit 6 [Empoascanara gracilis]
MMANLFSVFDPCTGSLSMNWLTLSLFLIVMPLTYWATPNKMMIMINLIFKLLMKEISTNLTYKGTKLLMLGIFSLILINNMMGLLPYVFTSTSHMVSSLAISLPIWISLMLYGWLNKTNKMFNHLIPNGTPSMLMPFMVIIETSSNIIRPGSLSVRLTANMIAGHLLMSLLGNNTNSMLLMISTMIIYLSLMIFELAVSMIQAYVMMTLTTLYSSEI